MSYRESEMIEIRTGISFWARQIMGRIQGSALQGACLEFDHPFVEPSIRYAIWRLDPLIVATWELQVQGENRWHLYKHWTPGKTDEATHFMLLQGPDRSYVPLDNRVVLLVREALQVRDPVEFAKQWLRDEDEKKEKQQAELEDGCREWAKYYRRLFARAAWGSVGSLWERGIELPYELNHLEKPKAPKELSMQGISLSQSDDPELPGAK